jgi:hypothetical protein
MKAQSPLLALAILLTMSLAPTLRADEPTAEAMLSAESIGHGLVVHVGASDGSLAEALARNQQVLVHALALDATTEAQLRQRFVKSGVHGQATAGRIGTDVTLPLADNVASIVVADLDAAKALKREELFRVLRPLGKAYLKSDGKWSALAKPRPKDVDDWAQYFHDAAMSDLSADRVSGPARGLQWQAGPQDTHSDGVRVIDDLVIGHDAEGLWARKVALAPCLGSGTTVSQSWLAQRLHMWSAANVSQQIRRTDNKAPLPLRLRQFLKSVKF